MANCREVITMALRKLNAIARGDDASAEEAVDSLVSLQSLYDELVLGGMFGRVIPARVAASATAEENTRIFNTTDGSITVTLPEEIDEGSDDYGRERAPSGLTLDDGGVRPPRDFSVVSIAGGGTYLYSQPRGVWDALTSLTLDSFAPLSERSADGLACLLAVSIADDVPAQVPAITASRALGFRSRVANRFGVERAPVQADYF